MTHNDRVLALLRDGEPHSHLEVYRLGVIAHSRVSDLRKRGYEIAQWRDGDLYFYRLNGGDEPSSLGESDDGPTHALPSVESVEADSVPAGSPHRVMPAGGHLPGFKLVEGELRYSAAWLDSNQAA